MVHIQVSPIAFIIFLFHFSSVKAITPKESLTKNDTIIGKLPLLDLDMDNLNSIFNKNTIYMDTVRFKGYEDVGDYSRLCVKAEEKEHLFLYEFSQNKNIVNNDIVVIYWSVVENHAIEDPEFVYSDILIRKLRKIQLN